ncbi:putative phage abortive infection protein [Chryseobacterium sp. c4a]|uniref:putative phage abortive infection protein n=1 Tax=Chryseobacterium sp. c4a TaxID=1573582 RepID=UPI001358E0B0|nr:putative phage abortive infection protein [Chryseobacterium sp. c4a]
MKNGNWVFWTFGLGSVIFMGVTLYFNYKYAVDLGTERQGLFGDMFGASNALFTGLSFVGVIIAILLQRQELKLQRKELELTRNEMELTREEFIAQNETSRVQRFENTFFQMLSLFNTITGSIRVDSGRDHYDEGKSAINQILSELEYKATQHCSTTQYCSKHKVNSYDSAKTKFKHLELEDLQEIYQKKYEEYNDILGHYFRTFYHIIKLIDSSDIKDKQQYASIARSQLSNAEQVLLFYNCLHANGEKKFKPLVEDYALLNNLNPKQLLSAHITSFYAEKAFGSN